MYAIIRLFLQINFLCGGDEVNLPLYNYREHKDYLFSPKYSMFLCFTLKHSIRKTFSEQKKIFTID